MPKRYRMFHSPSSQQVLAGRVLLLIIVVLLAAGCSRNRKPEDAGLLTPTPTAASTLLNLDVVATPAGRSPSNTPTKPLAAPTTTPLPVASPTATRMPASPTATGLPPTPMSPAPTATQAQPVPTQPGPTATPRPAEPQASSQNSPVRLVIADLKLDVPVVPMGWKVVQSRGGPVSEWVIPKNEAGHHINSAAMGDGGNIVISGHNNIFGRVFLAISRAWDDNLRQKVDAATDRSDALTGRMLRLVGADGSEREYVIQEFYRLKDTGVSLEQRVANARFMEPTGDERVTLITCWPPWNNTHRLVVIARPSSQP